MANRSESKVTSKVESRGGSFWRGKRVLVTGAGGFVGSNLAPLLKETGCELVCPLRGDYDLLEPEHVRRLFSDTRPQIVFHLAGLVGRTVLARPRRPCHVDAKKDGHTRKRRSGS